jgi:hypothetical protein
MLLFRSAFNLLSEMFTINVALDSLRAQKLHLKFTAVSVDYDYPS